MRAFLSRNHPCPECFGNAGWLANRCPHCNHLITLSNRFDWLPYGTKPSVFVALWVLLAAAGYQLVTFADHLWPGLRP